MKRVFALFIAAFIIISTASVALPESAAFADVSTGSYSLTSAGSHDRFTNYVDGYQLLIDTGMTVNMDYSAVCAVLEKPGKRIEIYKQELKNGNSFASYINYSNRFLNNRIDHTGIVQQTEAIGGRSVRVTSWARNKLSRIDNDKNYYVCLDISGRNCVYTIFVKSSEPISASGGYRYLASDFRIFDPTTTGQVRTSQTVPSQSRGWNEETQAFYNTFFDPSASLTWGIYEPNSDYSGYGNYNEVLNYEQLSGYKFPVVLSYTNVIATSIQDVKLKLDLAWNYGKVVELTLQTMQKTDGNMVYRLLNGEYDDYLNSYAATVREFGHPVMFRLFNEMNGEWCPYSSYNTSKDTQIYQAAYRYVYSIFENAGANQNTIWVWNPNSISYPNYNWNNALMYYPGDEFVDVIGMTAYNTGNYYSGETWQSFGKLYDDLYAAYSSWFTQPFMITEFSCSGIGGDKVAWMNDMFSKIKAMNRIKIAVWWDACDFDAYGNIARSYFIDETPETLQTFIRGIQSFAAPKTLTDIVTPPPVVNTWSTDIYA